MRCMNYCQQSHHLLIMFASSADSSKDILLRNGPAVDIYGEPAGNNLPPPIPPRPPDTLPNHRSSSPDSSSPSPPPPPPPTSLPPGPPKTHPASPTMDEEHPPKKARIEGEEEEEEDEDVEEVLVRYRARSLESSMTEEEASHGGMNGCTENEQLMDKVPPIPPRVNKTRESQLPKEEPFLALGGGDPLPPPIPVKQRRGPPLDTQFPPPPPPPPPQQPEDNLKDEQALIDELSELDRLVSQAPTPGASSPRQPDLPSHPSLSVEEEEMKTKTEEVVRDSTATAE